MTINTFPAVPTPTATTGPSAPMPLDGAESAVTTLPALLHRAARDFPGAGVRYDGGEFHSYSWLLARAYRIRDGLDRVILPPRPAGVVADTRRRGSSGTRRRPAGHSGS